MKRLIDECQQMEFMMLKKILAKVDSIDWGDNK